MVYGAGPKPAVGEATPGLVVLGSIRKQTEQDENQARMQDFSTASA